LYSSLSPESIHGTYLISVSRNESEDILSEKYEARGKIVNTTLTSDEYLAAKIDPMQLSEIDIR
jgi:hypothetical protein